MSFGVTFLIGYAIVICLMYLEGWRIQQYGRTMEFDFCLHNWSRRGNWRKTKFVIVCSVRIACSPILAAIEYFDSVRQKKI